MPSVSRSVLLATLFLLSLPDVGIAQTGSEVSSGVSHQIGLKISDLSGGGLCYQVQFELLAFEVSGYVDYSASPNYTDKLYVLGFESQIAFERRETWRIYGLAAIWNSYRKEVYDLNFPKPSPATQQVTTTERFETSIGIGAEWLIWDNVALDIDAGFSYANEQAGRLKELSPSMGAGVSFRL